MLSYCLPILVTGADGAKLELEAARVFTPTVLTVLPILFGLRGARSTSRGVYSRHDRQLYGEDLVLWQLWQLWHALLERPRKRGISMLVIHFLFLCSNGKFKSVGCARFISDKKAYVKFCHQAPDIAGYRQLQ